jgi:hypothetical protein
MYFRRSKTFTQPRLQLQLTGSFASREKPTDRKALSVATSFTGGTPVAHRRPNAVRPYTWRGNSCQKNKNLRYCNADVRVLGVRLEWVAQTYAFLAFVCGSSSVQGVSCLDTNIMVDVRMLRTAEEGKMRPPPRYPPAAGVSHMREAHGQKGAVRGYPLDQPSKDPDSALLALL